MPQSQRSLWNYHTGEFMPDNPGQTEEDAALEAIMDVLMNVPTKKWQSIMALLRTQVDSILASGQFPPHHLMRMFVRALAENARMEEWYADPVYRSLWKDDPYHQVLCTVR